MMNSYTQNRNIYPQSVTDAERMINNYVTKLVYKNNSNKKRGKKQDKEEEPTEEEETFPTTTGRELAVLWMI